MGASTQLGPMLLARDVSTPADLAAFAESPRPAVADSDTFTLFDSAYRS